jgi:hypothetical protein
VRHDGTYYLQIAALGYEPPPSERFVKEGFLPGYPAVVRVVAEIIGFAGRATGGPGGLTTPEPFLVAGIIASNAALLTALVLLIKLGRLWVDSQAAERAAVLLCANPLAFLLSCHLSEGLFLALAVGSLLAAERGRFFLAGLLGGAAAATRVLGVVLALPLFLVALRRGSGADHRLERVLPILLVPLGLVLTLVFMGRETGDPWIYFKVQRHFGHEAFPTLSGITGLFHLETYSGFEPAREFLNAAMLLILGALVVSQVRLTFQKALPWSALAITVPLFAFPVLAGHIISLPRYGLVLFPLYFVAARKLPGGWFGFLLALLSAFAQATLFMSWEAHQPVVI